MLHIITIFGDGRQFSGKMAFLLKSNVSFRLNRCVKIAILGGKCIKNHNIDPSTLNVFFLIFMFRMLRFYPIYLIRII
jgi:hypothetical protein